MLWPFLFAVTKRGLPLGAKSIVAILLACVLLVTFFKDFSWPAGILVTTSLPIESISFEDLTGLANMPDFRALSKIALAINC